MKIGANNAIVHRTGLPIRTVPQIKLYINGKQIDYQGPKTAKDVMDFVRKNLVVKKLCV